jgi:hypothetical protein
MSRRRKGHPRAVSSIPVANRKRPTRAAVTVAKRRRTWLVWLLVGTGAALLLGLSTLGGERLATLFSRRPSGEEGTPLSLTILHTNDTWGYLLPCG